MKTYEDWENSLDDSYSSQFSPDAWEFTQDAFNAGQQSRQAEIDELQKRVDEALDHAVNHGGYDDLTHIINILKGAKR